MRSVVGAQDAQKEEQKESKKQIDVHIGIFFEGSGLNMVREYINSKYIRNNDSNYATRIKNHRTEQSKLLATRSLFTCEERELLENTDVELNKIRDSLQDDNAYPSLSPEMLCEIEKEDGRSIGFTNVSMLYTLFTGEKLEGNVLFKRIYIEGAGTSDISVETEIANIEGYRWSELSGILGFGLGNGKTGVVALVSKAAKKVTMCVDSLKTEYRVVTDEMNLHFYVFGFSRGAACSRLFCHLLTRGVADTLKCENKFGEYGAENLMTKVKTEGRLFKVDKLGFLEEFKISDRVTVDFLGLYDTVASIGFLKRKDGSTMIGPLGMAGGFLVGGVGGAVVKGAGGALIGSVGGAVAGDVAANVLSEWHYNNVDEYGLYTSSKIKHICHLCAMDEFRENFALTNLGKSVPSNAVEIMIPGCHSDIGGSYLDKENEPVKIKKHKLLCINRDKDVYKMCFKPSNANPFDVSSSDIGDVSASSLEKLGWINGTTANVTQDDDIYVEMTRSIKRGYSDIPLAMMMKYFVSKVEKGSGFFITIPGDHAYNRLTDLRKIGDSMVEKVTQIGEGQRWWLVPGSDSDIGPYRSLRSKYLHFSAKEDLKNALINAPNYDENFVMCRITYHGDAGEQKSAAEGVHFLYELSGTVKSIEFGDNDNNNTPTAGKTNPYVRKSYLMRSAGKSPKVSI